MSLLNLSIIASAGIKAIVLLVYVYLYMQYKERFLKSWAIAWAVILLKAVVDPFIYKSEMLIPTLMFFQFIVAVCTFFLIWGTYDFAGRQLPLKMILSAAGILLLTDIGAILGLPLILLVLPNVLIYGLIYIQIGLFLFRNLETHGYGPKITAMAFIITGIFQFLFPVMRPDAGSAHWGYIIDGFLRLVIAVGFLLTYFEKARYDLAKKEAQFRLLAENAKDIIFRFNLYPQPHFDYISPSVKDISGFSPEEFYNDPDLMFKRVHPDDRQNMPKFDQNVVPTDVPVALRLLTKSEEQIWAEQQLVPIKNAEGAVVAIEGIIRDVTARKQLEQELFRLDRLNIVGQMAANIGHEIRNPLTTVRGYLQVLSRKKDVEQYQSNFILMMEELDRANSLITEYLSLSKNRLTDLKQHNLNTILEALYPLIQADATNTTHLICLDLGKIPDLLIDEKEIRQLILNLTRNGLEAMSPGKTLTIKTFAEEDAVILQIRDQGKEIPADIVERLGIPFFTTKDQGTGLGLAICYSIANRHRAKITVKTSPAGTTFSIRFPII